MNEPLEDQDFCPVTQPWMHRISLMQQTVLLAAIRGPDGLRKHHVSKLINRWLRRSILLCSFDRMGFSRPYDFLKSRGGSFTGPSLGPSTGEIGGANIFRFPLTDGPIMPVPADPHSSRQIDQQIVAYWEEQWPKAMHEIVHEYLRATDELPHHYQLHIMHAAEVLGYTHHLAEVRNWWHECYLRLAQDMHLIPESEAEMKERLGDSEDQWRAREV